MSERLAITSLVARALAYLRGRAVGCRGTEKRPEESASASLVTESMLTLLDPLLSGGETGRRLTRFLEQYPQTQRLFKSRLRIQPSERKRLSESIEEYKREPRKETIRDIVLSLEIESNREEILDSIFISEVMRTLNLYAFLSIIPEDMTTDVYVTGSGARIGDFCLSSDIDFFLWGETQQMISDLRLLTSSPKAMVMWNNGFAFNRIGLIRISDCEDLNDSIDSIVSFMTSKRGSSAMLLSAHHLTGSGVSRALMTEARKLVIAKAQFRRPPALEWRGALDRKSMLTDMVNLTLDIVRLLKRPFDSLDEALFTAKKAGVLSRPETRFLSQLHHRVSAQRIYESLGYRSARKHAGPKFDEIENLNFLVDRIASLPPQVERGASFVVDRSFTPKSTPSPITDVSMLTLLDPLLSGGETGRRLTRFLGQYPQTQRLFKSRLRIQPSERKRLSELIEEYKREPRKETIRDIVLSLEIESNREEILDSIFISEVMRTLNLYAFLSIIPEDMTTDVYVTGSGARIGDFCLSSDIDFFLWGETQQMISDLGRLTTSQQSQLAQRHGLILDYKGIFRMSEIEDINDTMDEIVAFVSSKRISSSLLLSAHHLTGNKISRDLMIEARRLVMQKAVFGKPAALEFHVPMDRKVILTSMLNILLDISCLLSRPFDSFDDALFRFKKANHIPSRTTSLLSYLHHIISAARIYESLGFCFVRKPAVIVKEEIDALNFVVDRIATSLERARTGPRYPR